MFRRDDSHVQTEIISGQWDNLNLNEAREVLDWLDNHPEYHRELIALAPDCYQILWERESVLPEQS